MIDPKLVDEFAKRVTAAIPSGISSEFVPEMLKDAKVFKEDLDKNVRAAAVNLLGKMDLVTREEFDIQSRVLERTRLKLEKLEKLVTELEKNNHSDAE